MKGALVVFFAGFGVMAQVTVAPLFPLDAAVADLGLLVIVFTALLAGPKATMWTVPLIALFLGFSTSRAPGLLLLAYLPFLPLAYGLGETGMPLNRYLRTLLAALATGLWARGLLGTAAFVQGAQFAPGDLIGAILLPGLVLDALLVTLLYIPCRLAGRTGRSLSLRRTGWVT